MKKRILLLSFLLSIFVLNMAKAQKSPDAIDYYNHLAYRCHEKGDKTGAARNFLLYLEEPRRRGMTATQQDSLYKADKRVYDQAAVNAMYLFFSTGDMDGVLKAMPYGRRIEKGVSNVYITSMEAAKEKGMNDLYLELLKEGVVKCPQNESFADQLIEYYEKTGNPGKAQAELDNLIAQHPESADLWYIKGALYFNAEKRDNISARSCFSKAIALDEQHVRACAAMGNTYIQDVNELRNQGKFPLFFSGSNQQVKQSVYKKELAEVQTYYYNARTYLEMARRMAPEKYPLWGEQLLSCYKILNQKDKYDALYKEMNEE